MRVGGGDRRALGHDEIAPVGGRREHAVVGELVGARGRNECRELLYEDERIKGGSRRAVAPMPFEAIDDAVVGSDRRLEHRRYEDAIRGRGLL